MPGINLLAEPVASGGRNLLADEAPSSGGRNLLADEGVGRNLLADENTGPENDRTIADNATQPTEDHFKAWQHKQFHDFAQGQLQTPQGRSDFQQWFDRKYPKQQVTVNEEQMVPAQENGSMGSAGNYTTVTVPKVITDQKPVTPQDYSDWGSEAWARAVLDQGMDPAEAVERMRPQFEAEHYATSRARLAEAYGQMLSNKRGVKELGWTEPGGAASFKPFTPDTQQAQADRDAVEATLTQQGLPSENPSFPVSAYGSQQQTDISQGQGWFNAAAQGGMGLAEMGRGMARAPVQAAGAIDEAITGNPDNKFNVMANRGMVPNENLALLQQQLNLPQYQQQNPYAPSSIGMRAVPLAAQMLPMMATGGASGAAQVAGNAAMIGLPAMSNTMDQAKDANPVARLTAGVAVGAAQTFLMQRYGPLMQDLDPGLRNRIIHMAGQALIQPTMAVGGQVVDRMGVYAATGKDQQIEGLMEGAVPQALVGVLMGALTHANSPEQMTAKLQQQYLAHVESGEFAKTLHGMGLDQNEALWGASTYARGLREGNVTASPREAAQIILNNKQVAEMASRKAAEPNFIAGKAVFNSQAEAESAAHSYGGIPEHVPAGFMVEGHPFATEAEAKEFAGNYGGDIKPMPEHWRINDGTKSDIVSVDVPDSEGSDLPPELAAVGDGKATAWIRPPKAEGTIPTPGERAVADKTGEQLAAAVGGKLFTGKDGTEVIYNPKAVNKLKLAKLDKAGKLPEIVNGVGNGKKPEAPTNLVVVKNPDGTEARTVLTSTPEQTASAVAAQPEGTKTEVLPADKGTAEQVLGERLLGKKLRIKVDAGPLRAGEEYDIIGLKNGQPAIQLPDGQKVHVGPRVGEVIENANKLKPKKAPKPKAEEATVPPANALDVAVAEKGSATPEEAPPADVPKAMLAVQSRYPNAEQVDDSKLTRDQREAVEVGNSFGRTVVFLKGMEGRVGKAFIHRDHPNVLFINSSEIGPTAVRNAIGTELFRSIDRQDPEVFGPFKKLLDAATLGDAKRRYINALGVQEGSEAKAKLEADPFRLEEAANATTFGDIVADERVWQALAKKDPTAFDKMANWITSKLGGITTKGKRVQAVLAAIDEARSERTEPAVVPETFEPKGRAISTDITNKPSRGTNKLTQHKNREAMSGGEETLLKALSGKLSATDRELLYDPEVQRMALENALAGSKDHQALIIASQVERMKKEAKRLHPGLAEADSQARQDLVAEGVARAAAMFDGGEDSPMAKFDPEKNRSLSEFMYQNYRVYMERAEFGKHKKGEMQTVVGLDFEGTRVPAESIVMVKGRTDDGQRIVEYRQPADKEAGTPAKTLTTTVAPEALRSIRRDATTFGGRQGSKVEGMDAELPAANAVDAFEGVTIPAPSEGDKGRIAATLAKMGGKVTGRKGDNYLIKLESTGKPTAISEDPGRPNLMRNGSQQLEVWRQGDGILVRDWVPEQDNVPRERKLNEKAAAKVIEKAKAGNQFWPSAAEYSEAFAKMNQGAPEFEFLPNPQVGYDPGLLAQLIKVKPKAGGPDENKLTPVSQALNRIGQSFVENDVVPTATDMAKGLLEGADDVRELLAPQTKNAKSGIVATILRKFNGRQNARLSKAADALDGARRYFSSVDKQESRDFINRVETNQPQPTPELQTVHDFIRKAFDERLADVQGLGTGKLTAWVQNYFPHLWKDPKRAALVFGGLEAKAPMEGAKSFLNSRVHKLYADGLAAGLEPVSENPVELALAKMYEMDKYIMSHRAMKEIDGRGLLKFFKATEKMDPEYARIDDKIATVYARPSVKDGVSIAGYYAAPEWAAKTINNYLSPGLRDHAVFRGWMDVQNVLNQAQLGFSAFHAGFTSFEASTGMLALGIKKLAEGDTRGFLEYAAKTPFAAFTNAYEGAKVREAGLKGMHGGTDYEAAATALTELAGGRLTTDRPYQTQYYDRMVHAFKQGNYIGGIARTFPGMIDLLSKPIMEKLVPAQKAGLFYHLYKHELARLGSGASPDQVTVAMQKAWDSVDNRFGQMTYDNLFWNKAVKDIAMATTRSVGWNLGTFRELGGGLYDTGKLVNKLVQGGTINRGEDFTHRMSYVVALPALTALVGGTMHYAMTGSVPSTLKDYFFPRTGEQDEDGHDVRMALPTYMKDVFHYHDAWRFGPDTRQTLKNKASPLLNSIFNMMSNQDYYGTKIWNEDDSIGQNALDVGKFAAKQFEPLGVREFIKMREQGQSAGRASLPFVGVTKAPREYSMSDAEIEARRLAMEELPVGARTTEEADRAMLRSRLTRGITKNPEATGDQIRENYQTGKLADSDIDSILNNAGKGYLERKLDGLGVNDSMRVFDKMTDEEKRKYLPDVMGKIIDSGSIPFDQQMKYVRRLQAELERINQKGS